jgi:hypothetical protein
MGKKKKKSTGTTLPLPSSHLIHGVVFAPEEYTG